MHVFFDPQGRPFLLDSQMRWEAGAECLSGKVESGQWKDQFTENVEELRVSVGGLVKLL